MKSLVIVGIILGTGALMAGCTGEDSREPAPSEDLGTTSQAITTGCTTLTIGLPCDPDGPAKPLLECEGVCGVGVTGAVACVKAVAGSNEGLICGTQAGVGDVACTRRCSGKSCLAQNALAGAACRPTNNSSPCDGQCDGAGKCDKIAQPCQFGRQDQLCTFETCNLKNATACVVQNLPKYTSCSDASACELGICSANGQCVTGSAQGCDDGNSCTDDACDPQTGGCIGTPNDDNGCSDGNACLTGESCSNGTCLPGTVPADCSDNNACTTDGCDPNTGCYHAQKDCSDANACTVDSCNPLNAECSHVERDCDDDDACTVDDCDPASGCAHTAKDCDDGNACTTDSCASASGACQNEVRVCDDGDPCTTDSCDTASGCSATAIPGCGDGAGGAGGANGDGEAGAATGGMAGESAGGGPPQGEGGMGEPSTAGQPAGGSPAGGSTSGGASGVSGSTSAGTNSEGATGASAPIGGNGDEPGDVVRTASGCGCRTLGSPTDTTHGHWLVALAFVGSLWRRRRRAETHLPV